MIWPSEGQPRESRRLISFCIKTSYFVLVQNAKQQNAKRQNAEQQNAGQQNARQQNAK
jgi:hypothetical protein